MPLFRQEFENRMEKVTRAKGNDRRNVYVIIANHGKISFSLKLRAATNNKSHMLADRNLLFSLQMEFLE